MFVETVTEGILAQHLDVNRLLDSFVGDVITIDEVERRAADAVVRSSAVAMRPKSSSAGRAGMKPRLS